MVETQHNDRGALRRGTLKRHHGLLDNLCSVLPACDAEMFMGPKAHHRFMLPRAVIIIDAGCCLHFAEIWSSAHDPWPICAVEQIPLPDALQPCIVLAAYRPSQTVLICSGVCFTNCATRGAPCTDPSASYTCAGSDANPVHATCERRSTLACAPAENSARNEQTIKNRGEPRLLVRLRDGGRCAARDVRADLGRRDHAEISHGRCRAKARRRRGKARTLGQLWTKPYSVQRRLLGKCCERAREARVNHAPCAPVSSAKSDAAAAPTASGDSAASLAIAAGPPASGFVA